jgi:hypothetical protein
VVYLEIFLGISQEEIRMSDNQDASKEAPKTSPAVENKPAPQQQNQGDGKPGEKPQQQK